MTTLAEFSALLALENFEVRTPTGEQTIFEQNAFAGEFEYTQVWLEVQSEYQSSDETEATEPVLVPVSAKITVSHPTDIVMIAAGQKREIRKYLLRELKKDAFNPEDLIFTLRVVRWHLDEILLERLCTYNFWSGHRIDREIFKQKINDHHQTQPDHLLG